MCQPRATRRSLQNPSQRRHNPLSQPTQNRTLHASTVYHPSQVPSFPATNQGSNETSPCLNGSPQGLNGSPQGLNEFPQGLNGFPQGLDETFPYLNGFSQGFDGYSQGLNEPFPCLNGFSQGLDVYSQGLNGFSLEFKDAFSDFDGLSSGGPPTASGNGSEAGNQTAAKENTLRDLLRTPFKDVLAMASASRGDSIDGKDTVDILAMACAYRGHPIDSEDILRILGQAPQATPLPLFMQHQSPFPPLPYQPPSLIPVPAQMGYQHYRPGGGYHPYTSVPH